MSERDKETIAAMAADWAVDHDALVARAEAAEAREAALRGAATELRRQMVKVKDRTAGTGPSAHRAVNDIAYHAVKRFDAALRDTEEPRDHTRNRKPDFTLPSAEGQLGYPQDMVRDTEETGGK